MPNEIDNAIDKLHESALRVSQIREVPLPPAELTRVALPSLYQLEEDLVALLDTEALVAPEQEAEFERDLADQLQKTVAKRDRVGAFIKTLEAQAKFAGEEIKRLQDRKRTFENVSERLRGYVLHTIESLGLDPKGKLRKLEGERFTLSARACPASLEITDEAAIPDQYKTITLSLPLTEYKEAVSVLAENGYRVGDWMASYSVDTAAVKALLTGPPVPCERCAGIGMVADMDSKPSQCPRCCGACSVAPSVPGCDLIIGRHTLQVK